MGIVLKLVCSLKGIFQKCTTQDYSVITAPDSEGWWRGAGGGWNSHCSPQKKLVVFPKHVPRILLDGHYHLCEVEKQLEAWRRQRID